MPPTHTDEGLQAAHRIRAERPRTGVLVLSQYLDEDYVFQLLGDGAQGLGYLLKDRITDGDAFVDAVRRVAARRRRARPRGRRPPARPPARRAARSTSSTTASAPSWARWPRAAPTRRSPQRLFLSDRAVERHVTAIFSKLRLAATPDSHRRVLGRAHLPPRLAAHDDRRDSGLGASASSIASRGGSRRARTAAAGRPPAVRSAAGPRTGGDRRCAAGRCGRRTRRAGRAAWARSARRRRVSRRAGGDQTGAAQAASATLAVRQRSGRRGSAAPERRPRAGAGEAGTSGMSRSAFQSTPWAA